jgi:Ca-activated chloride channel family protein
MKLFLAVVIIFMVIAFANHNRQSAPQPLAPTASAAQPVTADYYAGRPTQYTWPQLSQTPVQFSSSLLTQNYYLVIDGSGSMNDQGCSGSQSKIEVAKAAVAQFINTIPAEANVGLLVFDANGIGQRVALGGDRIKIQQQIRNISANGGTPLATAISAAYRAISTQAQQQYGYGEYHLVVVTDGEASNGEDPSRIVAQILRESPVTLHTIGFCIGSGHSLNVPGNTNYRAANNPEELLAGLKTVLAESSEYVIDDFNKAKLPQ